MRNFGKRKAILLGSLLLLLLAAGIGYANRGSVAAWGYDRFLSKEVEKKLAESYQPLKDRQTVEEPQKITEPFSTLLMGVDARDRERGRSDTLIYTVIRPMDGQVLMISIPRDTYAEIAGKEVMDKITHSYAYGGPEMAVGTVEKLLGARIDHYASINFQGFIRVVDTLGGIPLPITEDIVNKGAGHEKFTIKANQPLYEGRDALNYVRYREDAGDDISRAGRNRIFLDALMNKASSLQQWSKIPDIIRVVGENFRTDITPSELTDLTKQFLQTDRRIQSYTLKGEGKRIGAEQAWYYVADEEDLSAVRDTIRIWLDPDTPARLLTVPADSDPAPAAPIAGKPDISA